MATSSMELIITSGGGGRLCLLGGVNADLYRWINDSSTGGKIFDKAFKGVTKDEIACAMGLVNPADRRIECRKIIDKLWKSHPEIGPYPLLNFLKESEEQGIFYENYRDHVAHQFSVYLLGLYLYDSCAEIKKNVLKEIKEEEVFKAAGETVIEEEFLLRWLITALIHDIGYILENNEIPNARHPDPNNKDWKKMIDELNEILLRPLTHVYQPEGKEYIDQVLSSRLVQIGMSNTTYTINGDADLTDIGMKPDPLEKIEPYSTAPHDRMPNLLRKYYEFAKQYNPVTPGRECFIDHGITSALILLKIKEAFDEYITKIVDNGNMIDLKSLMGERIDSVKELKSKTDPRKSTVLAASRAIALHNINMGAYSDNHKTGIWSDTQLQSFFIININPADYAIFLSGCPEGFRDLPLAFLLGLADTLQDWDRLKFRERRETDYSEEVTSLDLSIKPGTDGKILLFYRKDPKDTPIYAKKIGSLQEFLQPEKIAAILWNNLDMTGDFTVINKITAAGPLSSSFTIDATKLQWLFGNSGLTVNSFNLKKCPGGPNAPDACVVRYHALVTFSEFLRLNRDLYVMDSILRHFGVISVKSKKLLAAMWKSPTANPLRIAKLISFTDLISAIRDLENFVSGITNDFRNDQLNFIIRFLNHRLRNRADQSRIGCLLKNLSKAPDLPEFKNMSDQEEIILRIGDDLPLLRVKLAGIKEGLLTEIEKIRTVFTDPAAATDIEKSIQVGYAKLAKLPVYGLWH